MKLEGCREQKQEMSLAMAYVKIQQWGDTYDLCKGYKRGTIFPDLDKPFCGRGGWRS